MSPQRCVRCTRCAECAVQLFLVNRCIYWSMKASSAPRLTNNYAKLAWVIPKFTKWALRSKTCLLSFRPSMLLNDRRPPNHAKLRNGETAEWRIDFAREARFGVRRLDAAFTASSV